MNLGKTISQRWNKFLCYLLGHSGRNICRRCGIPIDSENNAGIFRRFRYHLYSIESASDDFKGSINLKSGLKMYELNLKTNELRLLDVQVSKNEETGKVNRRARYDPFCCYIQAVNSKNALRKANAHVRKIKQGVFITHVTKADEKSD